MPPLKTTPDEIVRWMGLRFRVPCDWQMVRHSKNAARGNLVFVDRRRERLEVHWLDCRQEPDVERMLDNQRSLALSQDAQAKTEPLNGLGAWRALRTLTRGAVISRAVRFDPKTQRLVELVLSSSEDEDVGEVFPWFCRHFELEARAQEALRWAAFDIHVRVPAGYRLAEVDAKPCDALLEFEREDVEGEAKAARKIRVRRMGLVDSWYTGDAPALIRSHAKKLKFAEFSPTVEANHPATMGLGIEAAPLVARLRGRQVHAMVRLWHCAVENALYEVTSSGYPRAPIWPPDLQVHCRPHNHDSGPGEA